MTIAFRNSASGDIASATATVTISLPSGTLASDFVGVVFGDDYASVAAQDTTAPAGWSSIGSPQSVANGTTEHVRGLGFWAPGSIALLGFTNAHTGTSYQQGWVSFAISGVDLNNPFDVAGVNNSSTNATSVTASSLSITNPNSMHVIIASDWNGGVLSAPSFNVVENGHANASAALLYNPTLKSAGPTGTVAVSSSASGTNQIIIATSFALKPITLIYPNLERGIRGLNRGLCLGAAA